MPSSHPVLRALLYFISWKGFIYAVALAATYVLPQVSEMMPNREYQTFPYLIWVFGNLDGEHYLAIAQGGYLPGFQPFFPLFPLLMRIITYVSSLSLIITGQIVSVASLLLALYAAYRLLSLDGLKASWPLFLTLLFTFPTSFYYHAIYNDALFFLLATASLYLARRGIFFWAGFAGGLATLTRLNGLALLIPLLVEYVLQTRKNSPILEQWYWFTLWMKLKDSMRLPRLFRSGIIGILCIPASFVSYLWYIQIHFGDWMTLFSSMKTWDQDKIIFPLQVIWRYIKILMIYPEFHLNYAVAALELGSVFLYLFLLWFSYKKIRISYWLFFAFSLLIPSLTGTFQGMPRYGLHLYPMFLSLLLWLRTRSSRVRTIYLCGTVLLEAILIALYTRAYFVA